ncbi:MAG: hypothetical protein ILNGONEN_00428 [Syntrophorhabdaceae bacterium]|nr:hypothetical protein [Syntrophorhabdaceae bacterium]
MSIVVDAIRPFWISGLNNISGNITKSLPGWFCDEEFQVYEPLQPNLFAVNVDEDRSLLAAFAFDCSRMAIASFESISGINRNSAFPKSTAWLFINSYYAAFFAAHAILRMCGVSCSQIGAQQALSVHKIAILFGTTNGCSIAQGFYKCVYDNSAKKLICTKFPTSAGGVHESFWTEFYNRIRKMSNDILSTNALSTKIQQVSIQLSDLCDNLCYAHCNNGSWLSFIRNEINYQHRHATWYPYKNYKSYYDQLYNDRWSWELDPMTINLRFQKERELQRFQATCNFIISLCRVLVNDMAQRCSDGKSFHYYGSLAFLNLLAKGKRYNYSTNGDENVL